MHICIKWLVEIRPMLKRERQGVLPAHITMPAMRAAWGPWGACTTTRTVRLALAVWITMHACCEAGLLGLPAMNVVPPSRKANACSTRQGSEDAAQQQQTGGSSSWCAMPLACSSSRCLKQRRRVRHD